MINREHDLPITKQAATLNVNRGSVYYLPRPVSTAHLTLVRRIDELHLEFPFAGSRRLRDLAPDGAPDPGARSDQQPGLTEEAGSAVASMKTDDPCKLDAPIVAYYGSYTVDEAGKKIFGKIEAASYSPRANMETIWTVQGSGDKLTFILSLRKDQHGTFSPKSKYGVLHNCKERGCDHSRTRFT